MGYKKPKTFRAQQWASNREKWVLAEIKEHPDKSHNILRRVFENKEDEDPKHMSKKTFEQTIERLWSKGEIIRVKSGNRVYYRFPHINNYLLVYVKNEVTEFLSKQCDFSIDRLDKAYNRLDKDEKARKSIELIERILYHLKKLSVLELLLMITPQKWFDRLQSQLMTRIKKILDIIRLNSDRNYVFTTVINRLLDIKPSFDLVAV